MKRKSYKIFISVILMVVVSCDEPETIVTNYVHPDGTVTRKIEMRNIRNNFAKSDFQVPFDSTWAVEDSIEINRKGDTTWIKRAEKQFMSVDEINLAYKSDSGANKDISRQAAFKKSFKWFNTEFRFSERIDKKLSFGYPVKDFLNKEELLYFYSPDNLNLDKENGHDSLKFRALRDSVKKKTDSWVIKNITSEWIEAFSNMTEEKTGNGTIKKTLKAREDEIVKTIEMNGDKFDSLWSNGSFLKKFIGEANSLKYKIEADSAMEISTNNIFISFNNYSVRIVMPGKLIGTNGFIDSSRFLLWPVKSDYFLTEPYEMWAESKTPNTWAWIVSGLFLVFVITGVIVKRKRLSN